MKVYRYENKNGCGPYQNEGMEYENTKEGDLTIALYTAHRLETGHPGWKNDGLPCDGDLVSGCKTMASLKSWFRGFGLSLEVCGYYVAVYEVDAQAVTEGISGKQLNFSINHAKRIRWAGVDTSNVAL
jgi:hypothetical protein